MCGIWALFGLETNLCLQCSSSFVRIAHRGPDAWRVEYDDHVKNACVGFHRLAIVDGLYGMQPMKLHKYPHLLLLCNGELYNYKRLGKQFNFEYETNCDVEVILHLYATKGIENVSKYIDGVFGFILLDKEKRKVYLSRDPYGVRPLFRLRSDTGVLAVCSEAKGVSPILQESNGTDWVFEPFPPGSFEEYSINEKGSTKFIRQEKYYHIGDKPTFEPFIPYENLHQSNVKQNIKTLFIEACRKRLMSDRRIGCMLSGGLDSSLVAAIVVKMAKDLLPYRIQTFSIGMEGSPDLKAARLVADHIKSDHHEVILTEQDIRDALPKVLYHLETADITTVRASLGMYILSRYIKENTDTTVVFSGEGADELAQGYIYFRDAPSPDEAHKESLRLLNDIYKYDGLRADRTTAANCLELRVPFLDIQFTNYYLSLDKQSRQPQNRVEKHLLRSAFEDTDLLPESILWRHKEAFSDGVTSINRSLFDIIKDIVDEKIPDCALENVSTRFTHCKPHTKEALYYREVFEEHYPKLAPNFMPYFWMPKWINVSDPSARFISHYNAEKKSEVKS